MKKQRVIHHKLCEYLGILSSQCRLHLIWLDVTCFYCNIDLCTHGFGRESTVICSTFIASVSEISCTHNVHFSLSVSVFVVLMVCTLFDRQCQCNLYPGGVQLSWENEQRWGCMNEASTPSEFHLFLYKVGWLVLTLGPPCSDATVVGGRMDSLTDWIFNWHWPPSKTTEQSAFWGWGVYELTPPLEEKWRIQMKVSPCFDPNEYGHPAHCCCSWRTLFPSLLVHDTCSCVAMAALKHQMYLFFKHMHVTCFDYLPKQRKWTKLVKITFIYPLFNCLTALNS